MAHAHDVIDRDPHFVIDAETRAITDQSTTGTSLMQNDHNSERLTFEVPRTVDDHDMSLCNRVEVHFINIGANGQRNPGMYSVEDMAVVADNDELVMFTWLVARSATSLSGTLAFLVRFVCDSDSTLSDYVWNTAVYSSITIGSGMDNSGVTAAEYSDVLENWRRELIAAGEGWTTSVNEAKTTALAEIEEAKTSILDNMSAQNLVDVVTEQATANVVESIQVDLIVNKVLSRLPEAEGASF